MVPTYRDNGGKNSNKRYLYAVVGINSGIDGRKLLKILVGRIMVFRGVYYKKFPNDYFRIQKSNGYLDVRLLNDFPEFENYARVPLTELDHIESDSFKTLKEFCNTNKIDIDELLPVTLPPKKILPPMMTGSYFCCKICRATRPSVEVHYLTRKNYHALVLLSCLLMDGSIDPETATALYNESNKDCVRICQSHCISAAASLGREIQSMHGEFPVDGLYSVPKNIVEVFLAHLHVYSEAIGPRMVLNTRDIMRFFNETLAQYHSVEGWDVEEITRLQIMQARKREQNSSSKTRDKKKQKTKQSSKDSLSSEAKNGSASPLFAQAKKEPGKRNAEDSADFAERSTPSPCSIVTIASTSSFRGEDFDKHVEANKCKSSESNSKKSAQAKLSKRPGFSPTISQNIVEDCKGYHDELTSREFRERFRMSRWTFKILCNVLSPYLARRTAVISKLITANKVGAALEILAGNGYAVRKLRFMGSNAEEIFDHVLDALLQWSGSAIKWPNEFEQKLISQRFFETTEIRGIIGCLDCTVVGAPNPSDASSNGPHALNVAVVTDDKKQFRWVLAKYKCDLKDDTVFKRSLLCQQLKQGTKKGCLVGDDEYEGESFLLTPKSKENEPGVGALALRKAHTIVEEAIASWKWQFPILTSHIKSPKIARIIVGTAAIYNLTRNQGEPLFTADEG